MRLTANLFVFASLAFSLSGYGQQPESESVRKSKGSNTLTLHTLSIHIKDPAVHDSVFLFLKEQLQLPVYYQPITLGTRKYAGIYAGNLVLEPCGPYTDFHYASSNFKALFFGLTFEPSLSIPLTSENLREKELKHEVAGDEFIYLKDTALCGQNITISIMDRHEKLRDRARQDSLRSAISQNKPSGLGIERVKEIRIGYSKDFQFQKWKTFISPSTINSENTWEVGNEMTIRFIPGSLKEVKGIVFKVKSLEKAKQYLAANQLTFTATSKEIILEPSQAFGLLIYFSQ